MDDPFPGLAARSRLSSGDMVAPGMTSAWSWMSKGLTVRANSFSSHASRCSRTASTRRLSLITGASLATRFMPSKIALTISRSQCVAGDGLVEVVVDPQVDRHPVGGSVTVIDDRDQSLDPFEVLSAYSGVLP